MITLSTDSFSYHKDSNTFMAEFSDLTAHIYSVRILTNGLILKSAKTGKEMLFEPVFDDDGYDGEMWMWKSTETDKNGRFINLKIFND